jgi:hypothetical protein
MYIHWVRHHRTKGDPLSIAELATAQLLVEMHLRAAARWNAAAEDANRELDGARVITCRANAADAAALAGISLPVDAQILDVSWARETLIVAYRQPGSIAFEFAVDAYRLPTPTSWTSTRRTRGPRASGSSSTSSATTASTASTG